MKFWEKLNYYGKTLFALFLAGIIAKGATIRQRVFESHNGIGPVNTIVNCWVNDGGSGVQKDTINFGNGNWGVPTEGFTPEPVPGDTIKSVDSLNYNGTIYTGRMRCIDRGGNITLPTGFLDDPNKNVIALSVGANEVKNRSSRPQYTMNAKGWLKKNPNQKIQFINYYLRYLGQDSLKIDTTDFRTQLYFNLERQDSIWNQGDSFVVQIYQIQGDTMWHEFFTLSIDTLEYGMASIVDSLRYAPDSMVTGVVENKLEKIVKEGLIKGPNIVKGSDIVLNCEGDYYLYNALGKCVAKGKGNKINSYDLPKGAYFLFVKKDEEELVKPEKVLILK